MQPRYTPAVKCLLCCMLLVAAVAAHAQDDQIGRAIAIVKPSVVLISTADAQLTPLGCGTGFVIDPQGLVATCAHVLEDAAMITVIMGDKRQVAAKIVGVDLEHDLAILKLPDKTPCTCVSRSTDDLSEGNSVLVTGYPFGTDLGDVGLDLATTTTKGMITSLRKGKGFVNGLPMQLIQIDAKVNPGNSGGPLYYPGTGEIIGVVEAEIVADYETGINLAVPVSYLLDLLASVREGRAPVPPEGKPVKTPEKHTAPQAITRLPLPAVTELPIPEQTLPGGGVPIHTAGGRMLVDPKRPRLYVCEADANALTIINTDEMFIEKRLAIGSRPTSMALSPDNATLYVALSGGSQVMVLDAESLKVKESLQVGFQPYDLLSAAPNRLYIAATGDDWAGIYLVDPVAGTKLSVGCIYREAYLTATPDMASIYGGQTHLSPASIRRCDTAKDPLSFYNAVEGPIGGNLQDIRVSPDGKRVYVCCGAPYYVQVLDAATLSPVGQLDTGPYPRHVAISQDCTRVYATHASDHVDVFDASTFLRLGSIKVKGEVLNMQTTSDGMLALMLPNGVWLLDPAQTPLEK